MPFGRGPEPTKRHLPTCSASHRGCQQILHRPATGVVMHDTILEYLVLAASAYYLVRQGFFRPPGRFLTWPMFSRMAAYRVNMVDVATGEPIVPWKYMLHIDYLGGPRALQDFVDYLKEIHGIVVDGDGIVAVPFEYRIAVIRASRVDTR